MPRFLARLLPYTGWWGTFPAGTHHSHKLWGCIYPDIPEHTSWAALGTAACCVSSYEWPLLSPLGHDTRRQPTLDYCEAYSDTLQFSHAEFKSLRRGEWLIIFLFSSYAPHLFRHTVVVDLQCILLFVIVRRNNHPNHNNNLAYKKRQNRKNRLTWRLKKQQQLDKSNFTRASTRKQ